MLSITDESASLGGVSPGSFRPLQPRSIRPPAAPFITTCPTTEVWDALSGAESDGDRRGGPPLAGCESQRGSAGDRAGARDDEQVPGRGGHVGVVGEWAATERGAAGAFLV